MDSTDVAIDATDLISGSSYTLILETFDLNNGAESATLRTDSVLILIVGEAPVLATFTEELAVITVISGEEA